MKNWKRKTARPALSALITSTALLALAGCGKTNPTATVAAITPATQTVSVVSPSIPLWPATSVIYTLYPEIFSPQGNFAGVTAQLPRLKALGVTDVWIMPVTPIGHTIPGHVAFDSPYCVHDYYGVNPAYGTPADLKTLIAKAHKLGLRVLLDEVLNHTAWDNALITKHPEFYDHSDGNPKNPASIVQAFNYSDVAQLNYANPDLRAYMTQMLRYWLSEYHVDGFRFDAASNPDGPNRKIPADFWQQLGQSLRRSKPNVLMLGEEESPDLARKPFALDYAWRMYDPAGHGALKTAADGGDVSGVEAAWDSQQTDFPAGMTHMAVQDDWDTPRDVNSFGGPAGAQAVAVFNFTTTGVPLVYNGMEIGNAAGTTNPHAPIVWTGGTAGFPAFYHNLIALRHSSAAFTQGAMTWLPNTASRQVMTYTRTGGGTEFLIMINPTPTAASGKVSVTLGSGWKAVPLAGAKAAVLTGTPPQFSLPPRSFAIYHRPFTLAGQTAERTSLAALKKAAAAVPGDNAGNAAYAKGYNAGQNGGVGFTPFQVKTVGTAGTFVFTATEAEGNEGMPPPSSIDTGGRSFGLYAQSKDAVVTITRGFQTPLVRAGDTFSLDFVTGFNDSGTSGVALTTPSGTVGSFVFHSGGTGILFNGAATGIGFVRGAAHLVYTRTSPTTYSLKVSGAYTFSGTGTVKGPITGFQVQQTNSGSTKPDHNAYFNNLLLGHSTH